MNYLNCKWWKW